MALQAPFTVIVDTPDYWRGTLVDSPALVAGTVTARARGVASTHLTSVSILKKQ